MNGIPVWVYIIVGLCAVFILGMAVALVRALLKGNVEEVVSPITARLERRNPSRVQAQEEEEIPLAVLHDQGGVTGRMRYDISTRITTIGRNSSSLEPPIQHIQISLDTVSRIHTTIEYRRSYRSGGLEGRFWISDEGSTNGTFVNDKRLVVAIPLSHGDRIRIHEYGFEFVLPRAISDSQTVVATGKI